MLHSRKHYSQRLPSYQRDDSTFVCWMYQCQSWSLNTHARHGVTSITRHARTDWHPDRHTQNIPTTQSCSLLQCSQMYHSLAKCGSEYQQALCVGWLWGLLIYPNLTKKQITSVCERVICFVAYVGRIKYPCISPSSNTSRKYKFTYILRQFTNHLYVQQVCLCLQVTQLYTQEGKLRRS